MCIAKNPIVTYLFTTWAAHRSETSRPLIADETAREELLPDRLVVSASPIVFDNICRNGATFDKWRVELIAANTVDFAMLQVKIRNEYYSSELPQINGIFIHQRGETNT